MTTIIAPDLTPGYPSKGAKLGPAWAELWKALQDATEPLDGRALTEQVAPRHGLEPSTLNALLSRMKRANIIHGQPKSVDVEVRMKDGSTRQSKRVRTHYALTGR